jgi:dipeptidyl-peptidase-4
MKTATRFIPILALALLAAPLIPDVAPAEAQQLTVDRIFRTGEFFPDGLPSLRWTPGGERMTFVQRRADGRGTDLVAEDVRTGRRETLIDGSTLVPPGELTPVAIEGYEWGPDGDQILIYTRSERVWRRNTKGIYFVYDLRDRSFRPISSQFGFQMFAKFSPDGEKVGFVRDRNVYVVNLGTGEETQLTHDGGGPIINGTFDWVYEEELGLRDGWRWSPDSRRIAFWRLDETPIKTFNMIDDMPLYAQPVPLPYPKAGDPNSFADIAVVELESGEITTMDTGDNPNIYLARMEWAANSDEVAIQRLNRLQNRLDFLLADVRSGESRILFTEESETYVDVDNHFRWVRAGQQFVWTSDRDGFLHVYLYNRDGSLERQLTSGEWPVRNVSQVTDSHVYFTASPRPLGTQVMRVSLDGGGVETLSRGEGSHSANVGPGGLFMVGTYSSAGQPARTALFDGEGNEVRELVDNARLRQTLASTGLQEPEFFTFQASDGLELNGWMIKPADFDENREYPVLMYVYGGPGSQTVTDSWGGTRYMWHQLLAERGYIVASIDNRGTGARGRDFQKNWTYQQLGKWETSDQIDGARYLGSLPYVDADRIGIWGWSYGGFMTLSALMQGGDLFAAGVSVAPVTSWRFYDTIYTERYMRTPQVNASGYDDNSPLNMADGMTGSLLLIHGTGDDNVHFQNTTQMVDALQEAGKQFEFMMYPNRTHSISGSYTTPHLYTLMLDWLAENLPTGAEGGPVS